jgi:NAD(P)H-dependent FMN reductase
MSRILVIIGSVRARRIGPVIAHWVAAVGRETGLETLEVVDLRDWPLPMDGEPGIPAAGGDYALDHSRAWSRRIDEADAFVFVSPQYNWGYPAALKNALDHLYREWAGKPALIITYGGRGGDRCAAQLRQVLEGLHMTPVATMPGLVLARDQIQANSGVIDPAVAFAGQLASVRDGFADLARSLAPD